MTHHIVLVLGSNAADRDRKIEEMVAAVSRIVTVSDISAVIDSPDRSGRGAPYLNVAIKALYEGSLDSLKRSLRLIEADLGRDRSDRVVVAADIDIAVADGVILKPSDLESPPLRKFID